MVQALQRSAAMARGREQMAAQKRISRAYAKVWSGNGYAIIHHAIVPFAVNDEGERQTSARIKRLLLDHPGSRAAVSVRCTGAMSWCPVIGFTSEAAPRTVEEDWRPTDRAVEVLLRIYLRQRVSVAATTSAALRKRGLLDYDLSEVGYAITPKGAELLEQLGEIPRKVA